MSEEIDCDNLIIEPAKPGRLLATLASLKPLDVDLPDVDQGLPALDDIAI